MTSLEPAGGYHGGVAPAISVEEVARQALEIARDVSVDELDALAGPDPHLRIDDLHAGYGPMEILHGISLRVGHRQSLCLIGPNGAGKSTVLHSIFGFTTVYSGAVLTNRGGDTLTLHARFYRTGKERLGWQSGVSCNALGIVLRRGSADGHSHLHSIVDASNYLYHHMHTHTDVPYDDEEKVRIRGEVHRLVAPRDQRYQSNFVEVRQ